MSDLSCACGRPATHHRWGTNEAGHRGVRIPACAFHSVHPDAVHPFDIAGDPDWPLAVTP